MTNAISYPDWVEFIKTEYLDTFIRDGGSAIKFAVPLEEGVRPSLLLNVKQIAEDLGFLTAEVDARETKVHMMHEVFFRIAEQIDWESLAQQLVGNLVRESGYNMPADEGGLLLEKIAEQSGVDPILLRGELNRKLNERVFRHRGLAKDFRIAMVQLCMAKLSGGADGANTLEVLTDWLTGRNRRIGAVKPYMIFNTINRTNARYFFESLLNWIRFVGHSGLLVTLDTSRVTVSRNPRDGHFYYTKASVLDSYEVLRQFIDSMDRLQGCLILVSPDVAFLSEEIGERGFGAYEALKFRIVDEVRDRHLVNPMSSLIRLQGDTQGSAT